MEKKTVKDVAGVLYIVYL